MSGALPVGFHVVNGFGDSIDDPLLEQMREMLEGVDASDLEHGAAWLATDDEYVLEWNGDGRLVWSTPNNDLPRHLKGVGREQTLLLWALLACHDLVKIERQPWADGNGFVRPPGWERDLAREQESADREFYDRLGSENSETRCKQNGCTRGQIAFSSFCRLHHFEMIRSRPCPFGASSS